MRAPTNTAGLALSSCLIAALTACTKIENPAKPRTDSSVSAGAMSLPCAVSRVLRGKCQSCHGHPTQHDAPMSLTTWVELNAPAPSQPEGGSTVRAQIALRIHDGSRPMPPRGRPQLTDEELSTLEIWLEAGAPAGKDCESAAEAGASGQAGDVALPLDTGANSAGKAGVAAGPGVGLSAANGGSSAATGPGAGSGAASGGMSRPAPDAGSDTSPEDVSKVTGAQAGASDLPVPPRDDECEYVELRARNDESGSPYRVAANASDEYRCFIFDRKLDMRTQALSFTQLNDNTNVMQHWVLYSLESFGTRDVATKCDYTPGYKIIAAGAQGSDPWYLPADVGVEVGRGLFMLEVHYHNAGKPEAQDRSGVRVCLSKLPRPKVATVSWLGVERFTIPAKAVDYTVANRCRPASREPIHLLRYWPHMNRLGTRSSLRVDHGDGTSDTLHNATYVLDAQRSYAIPYVMQPTDSLLATCYYDNTTASSVNVGLKVSDEMCNHFVVAYPALALTNDAPSVWNDACLGAP